MLLVDMAYVSSHSLSSLDRRFLSAWLPYTNLNASYGVRLRYLLDRVKIIAHRGSGIEGLSVDATVAEVLQSDGFYQNVHPARSGRKEVLLENVGAKEGRPFFGKARDQGATQGPFSVSLGPLGLQSL